MATQEDSPVSGRRLRLLLAIDGVLVMALCIVLLAVFIPQLVRRYSPKGPFRGPVVGKERAEAAAEGFAIQDIKLYPPKKIARSDAWVIEIAQRDLEKKRLRDIAVAYMRRGPPAFHGLSDRATVNLYFYSEADPDGFLLFDRQVLITSAEIPRRDDTVRDYIFYTVVIHDTDGDGRLNLTDESDLWISDLAGRALTQVTPDSLVVESYSHDEVQKQIHISAWIRPKDPEVPKEHWDQRLYVFDVPERALTLLPVGQAAFEKARLLLQR